MRGSRSSDALVHQRRDQILEVVLDEGAVGIPDLARRCQVSEMTIHRDLDALADAGLVEKHRGRAVAPSALRVQTSAQFRMRAGARLKEAVGSGALPLLEGARTVFFDDSTTALPLLRRLGETATAPVTVVTNYLEAVHRGAGHPMLRMHLLGGDYVPDLGATFGSACVEGIHRWHFDVAVFSAPAESEARCYHPLLGSVAIKQAALRRAADSVLLLDHTKLGHTGPHHICDVSEAGTVVLDAEADPREVELMRRQGATVQLVPIAEPAATDRLGDDEPRASRKSAART
ncbi:DeoR/GlpR family DNA-binding transcription regulator [Segeticoccus rhizosphaerae]|jgi:DeoR/GlpR family transcriptional regulator of sugar metabolism|uniref:DeoR/GlpR family DNA-binding transcription regulator n=1 Tax=Segeticoccus rhizosphaerae TaxID=1104777 RepID=UPI0010C1462C|nr:DeoR/GlpR family DNA-binding transcription regulator [Ornithinicoccus soli]